MKEKDILKRLVKNDALFRNIHVITQNYDIIPNDKNHMGAYIEFQDLNELREDFLEELIDSIVDWIYSSDKFAELKQKAMDKGKSDAAATQEVGRKARQKFRADHNTDELLIQGQFGELLLFHFIQRFMKATPLLRKMKIATSSEHERLDECNKPALIKIDLTQSNSELKREFMIKWMHCISQVDGITRYLKYMNKKMMRYQRLITNVTDVKELKEIVENIKD